MEVYKVGKTYSKCQARSWPEIEGLNKKEERINVLGKK